MTTELLRVESNDPRRCQHTMATGQCHYMTMEDSENKTGKYCAGHIHLYDSSYRKDMQLKRYKLSVMHARVNDLFKDDDFKSLREEISILRFTLEQLMNQLQTPWDFMVYGVRVENTIEKISRITLVAHKLEQSLGQVLDKNTLAAFGDDVIRIISSKVTDIELLREISQEIGGAIERCSERAKTANQERIG